MSKGTVQKQCGRGQFNNEPNEERALKNRIDKLERLVGRMTMENEFQKRGLQHGLSPEGKNAMNTYYRHICTVVDALGTCKFHSRWMMPMDGLTEEDYVDMFNAATGSSWSSQDLFLAAERIYTLEHCYNVRLGMDRKDDTIPAMYFEEPMNTGPLKGHKLDRGKFEKMLSEYYAYWGWDVATGIPTRATLARLGMEDVAAELEKLAQLPQLHI